LVYALNEQGGYHCYDRDGNLLWSYPWQDFMTLPVLDGSNILIPTMTREDNNPVRILDFQGKVLQTIDWRAGQYTFLLPCDPGVFLLDWHVGPSILVRSEGGYVLEQWLDYWDSGVDPRCLFDSSGRLISLENAKTEMQILERSRSEAERVLVWGSELDVEGQVDYPYPVDGSHIASNGETVAILQPNSLLRYEGGELTTWIENFDVLGYRIRNVGLLCRFRV